MVQPSKVLSVIKKFVGWFLLIGSIAPLLYCIWLLVMAVVYSVTSHDSSGIGLGWLIGFEGTLAFGALFVLGYFMIRKRG